MSKEFHFKVKVYYEDTDAGGIVYYANYLKYLERARTELVYQLNLNHKILNEKYNTLLVVRSCNIKYKKPGFFEDNLIICTKLIGYSASYFTLEQIIKREKEVIVFSEIQLVSVNGKGKLIRMPDVLTKQFESIS